MQIDIVGAHQIGKLLFLVAGKCGGVGGMEHYTLSGLPMLNGSSSYLWARWIYETMSRDLSYNCVYEFCVWIRTDIYFFLIFSFFLNLYTSAAWNCKKDKFSEILKSVENV